MFASNKTIEEQVSSSISFVFFRDLNFPFFVSGKHLYDQMCGENEAEKFDLLNVERGPKASF